MATQTLSDLPVATTPLAADITHLRQSLVDKSLSMDLLSKFVLQQSAYSDQTLSLSTSTDLSRITVSTKVIFNVSGGAYTLGVQNGAATSGLILRIVAIGSSNSLSIKFTAGQTYLTVNSGDSLTLIWNGTAWIISDCSISSIAENLTSGNAVIALPDYAAHGVMVSFRYYGSGVHTLTFTTSNTISGDTASNTILTGKGLITLRLNKITSDWEIVDSNVAEGQFLAQSPAATFAGFQTKQAGQSTQWFIGQQASSDGMIRTPSPRQGR